MSTPTSTNLFPADPLLDAQIAAATHQDGSGLFGLIDSILVPDSPRRQPIVQPAPQPRKHNQFAGFVRRVAVLVGS